jgi:hypothetical protein
MNKGWVDNNKFKILNAANPQKHAQTDQQNISPANLPGLRTHHPLQPALAMGVIALLRIASGPH